MKEVAQRFEAEYIRDSDGLNVKAPTVRPRATEHIGEIIHIVKDLVDSGHAYVAVSYTHLTGGRPYSAHG